MKTKKTTEQEIKACLRKMYRLVHKYYDEMGYASKDPANKDPANKDLMDYYANICIGDMEYGKVCRLTLCNGDETYVNVLGYKDSY